MKIEHILQSTLGLTKQEVSVYLAALELGEATIQQLSRKSQVKRTSIYNFIDRLKDLQLINETRRKKRSIFSATNPKQVLELNKVKIKELEGMLPQLQAINNLSLKKPRVTFHEGIDGIKDIYNDMLGVGQSIVGWSDYKNMIPILGKEYSAFFPPERARRKIPYRAISNDTPENRKYANADEQVLRETKFISSSEDMRTEINIYGNKVILASFRSSPAFAVLIEDRDIAQSLRITWNELWQRL